MGQAPVGFSGQQGIEPAFAVSDAAAQLHPLLERMNLGLHHQGGGAGEALIRRIDVVIDPGDQQVVFGMGELEAELVKPSEQDGPGLDWPEGGVGGEGAIAHNPYLYP